MTFILTNDDGIDAPGLATLRQALAQVTDKPQKVVAPKAAWSGCGHQVTLQQRIHVERRSDTEAAVDGTPADCVRLALQFLHPEAGVVLSGINGGNNLGSDIYPSGTIAAAREATLHGVSAIAFSQYKRTGWDINWAATARWTARVLERLLDEPPEAGAFWSVNFPHLDPGSPEPELVFCRLCTRPLLTTFAVEGDSYRYIGDDGDRTSNPGTDVEVCLSGHIAIVKVKLSNWDA